MIPKSVFPKQISSLEENFFGGLTFFHCTFSGTFLGSEVNINSQFLDIHGNLF
jgi:hypothetical protein